MGMARQIFFSTWIVGTPLSNFLGTGLNSSVNTNLTTSEREICTSITKGEVCVSNIICRGSKYPNIAGSYVIMSQYKGYWQKLGKVYISRRLL